MSHLFCEKILKETTIEIELKLKYIAPGQDWGELWILTRRFIHRSLSPHDIRTFLHRTKTFCNSFNLKVFPVRFSQCIDIHGNFLLIYLGKIRLTQGHDKYNIKIIYNWISACWAVFHIKWDSWGQITLSLLVLTGVTAIATVFFKPTTIRACYKIVLFNIFWHSVV